MNIDMLLRFSGIVLISFLGLIVGRFIFFIAPEELDPGRKYLQVLMAITLAGFLFFATPNIVAAIIISSLACLLVLIMPKDIYKSKHKKLFIILDTFCIGFILAISKSVLLQAGIAALFLIAFSGYFLEFKKRDVNYKYGEVKNKLKYIKEIVLPALPYFLSIVTYVLFKLI